MAATTGPQRVVVVLRDTLPDVPPTGATLAARELQAKAEQQAVLGDLAGPAPTAVQHLILGNTVAATVDGSQVSQLRADPRVREVVADSGAAVPVGPAQPQAGPGNPAPVAVPANACTGTQANPQLEPSGLEIVGARSDNPAVPTAAALGLDGAGVKVAFMADAMDPANVDFRRADGTSAVVDQQVFVDTAFGDNGGEEAFGDAATIGAQGRVAHDLATVVNPAAVTLPGGHCWIRVEGVAPGAQVYSLDSIDNRSFVPVLQAIDYAVTVAKVDVLNQSFGVNVVPEGGARDAIVAADDAAIAAGVTVVVSSGDSGINGTIATPAASPDVITVGASTHFRDATQSAMHPAGVGGSGWTDDQISGISSSGITSAGRTVDLVAPGDSGWIPCSTNVAAYSECASNTGPGGTPLTVFAGTSEAAPFTSGTAALIIQAYRRTHGSASPTPALVKQILTGTAHDLGAPADLQGAGRLDARAAVEAALEWPAPASPAPVTDAHLVSSAASLIAAGTPGQSVSAGPLTLTNTGSVPVHVTPTVRSLVDSGHTDIPVTIPDSPTAPSFASGDGLVWDYADVAFTVPPGTDFMRVATAGVALDDPAGVGPQLALLDRSGRLTASSFLQAATVSRTEATLSAPTAGTWHAIVYALPGSGLTSVRLATESYRWTQHAWITPAAADVPAGGQVTFAVTPTIPVAGGDSSATIDLGQPGSGNPGLVLRSELRPAVGQPAPIRVTLRGGNGRSLSLSQSASYLVDVPAGHRQLTADISAPTCGCIVYGVFISPTGQLASVGSTLTDTSGDTADGLHQTVADPAPGPWRYVLMTGQTLIRTTPTSIATGAISLDRAVPTATGLPVSASTTLPAGKRTTVPVAVTNPGAEPMTVQIDAQRNTLAPLALQFGTVPPDLADLLDGIGGQVVVPPGAVQVSGSLTSAHSLRASLLSQAFEPIAAGPIAAPGQVSTATLTAPAPGLLLVTGGPAAAFSMLSTHAAGSSVPTATGGGGTVSAMVVAPAFDPWVSSPAGSNFAAAAAGKAPTGTAVVIAPGATASIPVTITPPASAAGQTITGRLLVSTSALEWGPIPDISLLASGDDVVGTLAYSYRVVAAPVTPTNSVTPQSQGGGALAATGPEVAGPLLLGLSSLMLGFGLLMASRPRGRRPIRDAGALL